MKVLSIDLDYIMAPSIDLYDDVYFDNNPTSRWEVFFDRTNFTEGHLYIDQSNLLFCYNTFLRSLRNCDSVSFGYEHDSILFSIADWDNIDLINIDHHDDVFGGEYTKKMDKEDAYKLEYYQVLKHNRVHEGNWGSWLSGNGKINSFTWIGNSNSRNKGRNIYNEQIIPNYKNLEKEDYNFEDYNFDHIFVCMSPQYLAPNYWHYFMMFVSAFEQFTGKDATIHTEKFETHIRYQLIHNEILHQCSDGR